MEKNFATKDLTEARKLADRFEAETGMTLTYKETIGFVPGAIFVFTCKGRFSRMSDFEVWYRKNYGFWPEPSEIEAFHAQYKEENPNA